MEGTSPQLDTVYRILADRRRRLVLDLLRASDGRLTLNDLAKEIAVRECDASITELPDEAVNGIYLSLYHVHAPKLADAGFVEYDRDRSIVEPMERLDLVEPVLSVAESAAGGERRSGPGLRS